MPLTNIFCNFRPSITSLTALPHCCYSYCPLPFVLMCELSSRGSCVVYRPPWHQSHRSGISVRFTGKVLLPVATGMKITVLGTWSTALVSSDRCRQPVRSPPLANNVRIHRSTPHIVSKRPGEARLLYLPSFEHPFIAYPVMLRGSACVWSTIIDSENQFKPSVLFVNQCGLVLYAYGSTW